MVSRKLMMIIGVAMKTSSKIIRILSKTYVEVNNRQEVMKDAIKPMKTVALVEQAPIKDKVLQTLQQLLTITTTIISITSTISFQYSLKICRIKVEKDGTLDLTLAKLILVQPLNREFKHLISSGLKMAIIQQKLDDSRTKFMSKCRAYTVLS